ncbi:MAG: outer membrane protein assembly factor BamD, partial [Quisquiliibacterium sp.]
RNAFVAAANRAQEAIRKYPQAPAIEEALYILMRSYEQLGLEVQRSDTERVFKANFPQSQFLTGGVAAENKRWWQVWR